MQLFELVVLLLGVCCVVVCGTCPRGGGAFVGVGPDGALLVCPSNQSNTVHIGGTLDSPDITALKSQLNALRANVTADNGQLSALTQENAALRSQLSAQAIEISSLRKMLKDVNDTVVLQTQPRTCREWLQVRGQNLSGVYRVQPDTDQPPFDTYCGQQRDEGGWTLLIVYDQSQLPIATMAAWPDVRDVQGVFSTRMFKGSLAAFSEVREEIVSGRHIVWGSNKTMHELNVVRTLYSYAERIVPAAPSCRTTYLPRTDNVTSCNKYGAGGAGSSVLGWTVDVSAPTNCWAGRGDLCLSCRGSSPCSGTLEPNGQFWSRVYFR